MAWDSLSLLVLRNVAIQKKNYMLKQFYKAISSNYALASCYSNHMATHQYLNTA